MADARGQGTPAPAAPRRHAPPRAAADRRRGRPPPGGRAGDAAHLGAPVRPRPERARRRARTAATPPPTSRRLQTMRRLTLEGVPPGEAARRRARAAAGRRRAVDDAPLPDSAGPAAAASRRAGRPRCSPCPAPTGSSAGSAGRRWRSTPTPCTALVREEVAEHGVLHTWDHVLRPVLVAVGARWAATGEGVEVEHLLSDCTAVVLRDIASAAPELPGPPAGAAVLRPRRAPQPAPARARRRAGGARRRRPDARPGDARRRRCRRRSAAPDRPRCSSGRSCPGTADPAVLEALPVTRPPTAVVVGGPGWVPDRLPRRVTVAADLSHALELVDRALGA